MHPEPELTEISEQTGPHSRSGLSASLSRYLSDIYILTQVKFLIGLETLS